jgi:hypothetical protein
MKTIHYLALYRQWFSMGIAQRFVAVPSCACAGLLTRSWTASQSNLSEVCVKETMPPATVSIVDPVPAWLDGAALHAFVPRHLAPVYLRRLSHFLPVREVGSPRQRGVVQLHRAQRRLECS